MNHLDVRRRNWDRFYVKLAANKDHESNNLSPTYRLKIARDLHNHLLLLFTTGRKWLL